MLGEIDQGQYLYINFTEFKSNSASCIMQLLDTHSEQYYLYFRKLTMVGLVQ